MHGGVGLPDNILQTAREYTTQNIYLFNIHNYFPMWGRGNFVFQKEKGWSWPVFIFFLRHRQKSFASPMRIFMNWLPIFFV